MASVALERGDDAQALGPLRRALRLARDRGSGERMTYALDWQRTSSTTAGVYVTWRRWWGPWRRCTCGSLARKNTCCHGARALHPADV